MGEPQPNMTSVLISRGDWGTDTHRGKTVGRFREEMATYKPRREASG